MTVYEMEEEVKRMKSVNNIIGKNVVDVISDGIFTDIIFSDGSHLSFNSEDIKFHII